MDLLFGPQVPILAKRAQQNYEKYVEERATAGLDGKVKADDSTMHA
jgi:hypothetical protein